MNKSTKSDVEILFVCLGNICRSPAAEGMMKHLIAGRTLPVNIHCDSAGILDYHEGEQPDSRMIRAAANRGIDITDQRSRPINPASDFNRFDYIVCMDNENLRALNRICPPELLHKISKMSDYCRENVADKIPDPYYGDQRDFNHVLDLLEDACSGFLDQLVMKYER